MPPDLLLYFCSHCGNFSFWAFFAALTLEFCCGQMNTSDGPKWSAYVLATSPASFRTQFPPTSEFFLTWKMFTQISPEFPKTMKLSQFFSGNGRMTDKINWNLTQIWNTFKPNRISLVLFALGKLVNGSNLTFNIVLVCDLNAYVLRPNF